MTNQSLLRMLSYHITCANYFELRKEIFNRPEKKMKLAELKSAPGGNIFCRIDTLDWTKFPQAHITMVSKEVNKEDDIVFLEEPIEFNKERI